MESWLAGRNRAQPKLLVSPTNQDRGPTEEYPAKTPMGLTCLPLTLQILYLLFLANHTVHLPPLLHVPSLQDSVQFVGDTEKTNDENLFFHRKKLNTHIQTSDGHMKTNTSLKHLATLPLCAQKGH